jgi:restriction system protein
MVQANEVNTAFEILLEEVELVANTLNDEGMAAFQGGNYDAAQRAIEKATRLTEFREKVKALQKEWGLLPHKSPYPKTKSRRRRSKRLPRGERTPEDSFRQPILESLEELGGQAPVSDVLDLVYKKMQAILKECDFETLPSDRRTHRWRNTAQWCRNTLVREGLMKSDSQRGIWEISDEGKQRLKDQH